MVTRFSFGLLISACGLSLVIPALGQAASPAPRFPSNEDLRHVRSMAQPRLSPDGRSVIITVTDSTADGARSHLWLVDIKQNTARQLTFTPAGEKRGENNGQWMPDGDSILFLAHRGEHTQLYRLSMEGGEARAYDLKITPTVDTSKLPDAIPPAKADSSDTKVEPLPIDVENYAPSPDGRWIALLAHDPETPGEKKAKDEKADAVWVDHDPHGSRLYLLDPESGKLTPVAVEPDAESIAWAKQSDRLIVVARGMNNAGDLGPDASTWLVSTGDPAHPRKLTQLPATLESATWSEDGKRLYFIGQSAADAPPGYSDLFVYNFADDSTRNLTAAYTGSLAHQLPIPDDSRLLVPVQAGTRVGVLRINPDSPADKQEAVKFDTATVTNLDTNDRHNGWVWLGASSTQPLTLYYAEKLGRNARALNAPTLMPASWGQVQSQLVSWKNESQTIEGLLYLPPEATAKKVPLIVDVHGGPTGAFEDGYYPLIEFLLGQGWAVFRTNPRGSTGYGAAFAAANKNDLGGADYRDIMTGIDTVLARYPLDPSRMALMGYSYGGEMAGFVEGKTTRFKAIVSGAPVIDQNSEYGTESGSWYDRWFYGKPWDHEADAWRQSPLSGVGHAKTPFLLLQGEGDTTDPLGQSLEMYRALRQMGVPVDMVQYPRENHGPLATGIYGNPSPEPWHGFDGRQRIVKFFKTAFGE
ncbi:prolyl oligopeptidase family serine peptidase [Silvibacterium sp.]|uniref:S9 family peptidase n=1 Tax=Silvibacterium sp. TaxID=1964179 RepID=UPI0039E2FE88